MKGIESSNSTSTHQYSESDLNKIQANANEPNKHNNSKFGIITTVSVFSALVIGGCDISCQKTVK
jgi:hypothetical protein